PRRARRAEPADAGRHQGQPEAGQDGAGQQFAPVGTAGDRRRMARSLPHGRGGSRLSGAGGRPGARKGPMAMTDTGTRRQGRAESGLAAMSPAYFGLVMATGIVSLAADMMGHRLLA